MEISLENLYVDIGALKRVKTLSIGLGTGIKPDVQLYS